MTRYPTMALLALLLIGCANDPSVGSGGDPITLTRGALSITLLPELGGRVASLTLNGREVLRTDRDPDDLLWGSTVWTSPQTDWGWPPPATFDRAPYTVMKVDERSVVLRSAIDSASQLQLTKSIRLGPENDVGLTYFLTYKGDAAIRVAAWENTRFPYGGQVRFSADSLRSRTYDFVPEDGQYRIVFDDRYPSSEKIFADLAETPVVYVRDGIEFRKFTDVTAFNRVPDTEAPLEIFFSDSLNVVEIELTGDYQRLGFDEYATLRTRWQIVKE